MTTENDSAGQVETMEFAAAADFLAALRPSDSRWLPPFESRVRWIFRGQRDADWGLVPSAWRSICTDHPAYKLALNGGDIWLEVSEELRHGGAGRPELQEEEMRRRVFTVVVQRCFEQSVTENFSTLLDELGMPIPDGRFPEGYFWDYSGFVCGPSLCLREDGEVSMIHALAQHHRNPTRLLDWTTNPLYAAFFAASDTAEVQSDQIAVWAVHRDDLTTPEWQHYCSGMGGASDYGFMPTGWRAISYPRHQSAFMHAQSGVFTFFSNAGHHYVVNGRWPDMESHHPPKRMRKLTLPHSKVAELLRLLRAEGISKAHLMPHLDNISEALCADFDATLMRLGAIVGVSGSTPS